MFKFAVAASAVVAAGTVGYLVHSHSTKSTPVAATAAAPTPKLHYGGNLGITRAPTLGPSSAPRAIASRSVAEADLALLPADSEAVIGVNYAKMRQSALWKRFVEPALVTNADTLRRFETLCGFDPLASLGSISLGLKGLGEDDPVTGVIIVHGFERAKAMSCFDSRGVPKVEQTGSKVTVDGDIVRVTDSSNLGHVAFTFIDNTTALVVIGPEAATKEGVQRIAAGDSGLQSSTTFASALQAINTDDSFWLVLADSSPLVGVVNEELAPYTSIKLGTMYMSLDVTDSLVFDAGLRLGSPDEVAKIVGEIQQSMTKNDHAQEVKEYFDQLDIMADGSDLIVSVSMSGDQILKFVMAAMTTAEVTTN